MSIRILVGDVRDKLAELADESVHCVVTSPPYFGLRDYGTAAWEGGDPACDHVSHNQRGDTDRETPGGKGGSFRGGTVQFQGSCNKCGAVRADKQIGLEATPDLYVAAIVQVFREVRRVLRNDGALFLNLGDSYAGSWAGNSMRPEGGTQRPGGPGMQPLSDGRYAARGGKTYGLKPKDLIGIPWMVAFALRADGWYLRQDIIWAKPNPMPESVTDRCTKAHEYLFLLSKSARYHYDAEAIAEDALDGARRFNGGHAGNINRQDNGRQDFADIATRNRRSVWTVATAPFSASHFATFPPALIEPCIKAGCPKDCCAKCGAPVVRQQETVTPSSWEARKEAGHQSNVGGSVKLQRHHGATMDFDQKAGGFGTPKVTQTTGWSPSCTCDAGTVPGVCLDPFGGAGTTGLVADRLQRDAILIELNEQYAEMARRRLETDAGMFGQVELIRPAQKQPLPPVPQSVVLCLDSLEPELPAEAGDANA